jgi:hypothetical protein
MQNAQQEKSSRKNFAFLALFHSVGCAQMSYSRITRITCAPAQIHSHAVSSKTATEHTTWFLPTEWARWKLRLKTFYDVIQACFGINFCIVHSNLSQTPGILCSNQKPSSNRQLPVIIKETNGNLPHRLLSSAQFKKVDVGTYIFLYNVHRN